MNTKIERVLKLLNWAQYIESWDLKSQSIYNVSQNTSESNVVILKSYFTRKLYKLLGFQ
jgi:hypothetical protein